MSRSKAKRPSRHFRLYSECHRRYAAKLIAKKHKKWKPVQTELFYKRLSQFGADFPRIALSLNRAPEEIADKYRTEKDINPQQIVRALAVRIAIEPNLFPIVVRPKSTKPASERPYSSSLSTSLGSYGQVLDTGILNSDTVSSSYSSASGQTARILLLMKELADSMYHDEEDNEGLNCGSGSSISGFSTFGEIFLTNGVAGFMNEGDGDGEVEDHETDGGAGKDDEAHENLDVYEDSNSIDDMNGIFSSDDGSPAMPSSPTPPNNTRF